MIKIGIIDDDKGKIVSIKSKLKMPRFTTKTREDKYSNRKMDPEGIAIEKEVEKMVSRVVFEDNYDALLIDYKLSSQSSAGYNGIELANEILNIKPNIPIFILTSYGDELFDTERFSSYHIFDVQRFLEDSQEQEELYIKIIEQCEYVNFQIKSWKREHEQLKNKKDKNDIELSRYIELDNLIEETNNKKSSINLVDKVRLEDKEFDNLIDSLKLLLGEDFE